MSKPMTERIDPHIEANADYWNRHLHEAMFTMNVTFPNSEVLLVIFPFHSDAPYLGQMDSPDLICNMTWCRDFERVLVHELSHHFTYETLGDQRVAESLTDHEVLNQVQANFGLWLAKTLPQIRSEIKAAGLPEANTRTFNTAAPTKPVIGPTVDYDAWAIEEFDELLDECLDFIGCMAKGGFHVHSSDVFRFVRGLTPAVVQHAVEKWQKKQASRGRTFTDLLPLLKHEPFIYQGHKSL